MVNVQAECDAQRRPDIERIEESAARWAGERFDLDRLERLVELHAGGVVTTRELALIFGLGVGGRSTVSRARSEGLTAVQADRWSIAAGFHPALVWGLQWYNGPVEHGDELPAEPSTGELLDQVDRILGQHARRQQRARTGERAATIAGQLETSPMGELPTPERVGGVLASVLSFPGGAS